MGRTLLVETSAWSAWLANVDQAVASERRGEFGE